jgi:hypothetical protein
MDITNQSLTRFLGGIRDVVCANINNDSAGLELFASDELGLSDSSDNNVRSLENLAQVLGLGMAHCHSRIGVLEQVTDGAADDVTTANNHGLFARRINAADSEKFHDTLGCAGNEQWLTTALGKGTDAHGTETIDVLFVRNGGGDGMFGDVIGQRKLDEYTMNFGVIVGLFDFKKELCFCDSLRELDDTAENVCLVVKLLACDDTFPRERRLDILLQQPSISCAHMCL